MGKRESKKSSYDRRALIVSKVADSENRRSLISNTYLLNLEPNLNRHIAYLDKIVIPKVPHITFRTEQFSRDIANKYINFLQSRSSNFRIVVNVRSEQFNDDFSHSKIGISHLVEIHPNPHRKEGWEPPSTDSYSSSLVIDPKKLAPAIEDICVDIALFHTWEFLSRTENDIYKREEFSKKKVAYALKHNLQSFYGPISKDCKYVSLCSFGRHSSGLEYEAVYNIWKGFLQEYYPSQTKNIDEPSQGEKPLFFNERPGCDRHNLAPEQQLRYCTFKDQLPKKAFREANNLTPGWHILTRIAKNPKGDAQTRIREQIKGYMGGAKFRLGRICFFQTSRYSDLKRFFPYLQFFRIKVT